MCSVMAGQLFAYQCNMGGAVGRARANMSYCNTSSGPSRSAKLLSVIVLPVCDNRQSGFTQTLWVILNDFAVCG